jgi:hypothetical protein
LSKIWSIEYVLLIPKTINSNGCWIPPYAGFWRDKDGYVVFSLRGKQYRLHRVAMSAKYEVDYFDKSNLPRHLNGCSTDCFNPDHILIGTHKDNMQDRIVHGNNPQLNKEFCHKCGGEYKIIIRQSGPRKGMQFRRCQKCANKQRQEFKEKWGY